MAVLTPGSLKQLFETGDQPSEQAFIDLIDSMRHVSASIPAADVTGLVSLINSAVDASTGGNGTDLSVAISANAITIVNSSGDNAIIPLSSSVEPGLFSPDAQNKLDGIEAGATADLTPNEILSLLLTLSDSELEQLVGDGAVGPAGPQGEAGPQGPQGPAGPAGSGGASTSTQRGMLTTSGITVDIEWSGTAPSLSGSNGNYTLTIPAGCRWINFHVDAPVTANATNGGEFSLAIINASGFRDWSIAEITEYGDYEAVDDDGGDGGIKKTQTPTGTDRVTTNWTNLTGLSGFGAFFNR